MTTNVDQTLPVYGLLGRKSSIRSLGAADQIFALVIISAAVFVQTNIDFHVDIYEMMILWTSTGAAILFGWFFKPVRWLILLCLVLAYDALSLYRGGIGDADGFLLKYFLGSQSAIMWQCALVFFALFAYISGAFVATRRNSETNTLLGMVTVFAWISAVAGFTGLLVRWRESYLLRLDAGHIPVANLYGVFILFSVVTALAYLYYEKRFGIRKLGGFVLAFTAVVVGFVLWYSVPREMHAVQPLVPAPRSWWMKIHVPANFIGYGAFYIAATLDIAELLAPGCEDEGRKSWLPHSQVIKGVMYKTIAIGFLLLTIAIILGALQAVDTWGCYWSWGPKETWVFIVQLDHAVWLHLQLVAGWHGRILAWWAAIGLFVTAFAFIGVNTFSSSLHSYGTP